MGSNSSQGHVEVLSFSYNSLDQQMPGFSQQLLRDQFARIKPWSYIAARHDKKSHQALRLRHLHICPNPRRIIRFLLYNLAESRLLSFALWLVPRLLLFSYSRETRRRFDTALHCVEGKYETGRACVGRADPVSQPLGQADYLICLPDRGSPTGCR